jgi:SAM-dependent methyltransferase
MTVSATPAQYDEVADHYDRLVRPKYEPIAALVSDHVAGRLVDADVVELSAGTGTLTHLLAPHASTYLATDVSEPMMEVARACPATACRRVTWTRADVAATGLPSASADVVVSSLGPFQDSDAGLGEALRLLRPGGRLVATTWGDDYLELDVLQAARARLGLPPRTIAPADALAPRLRRAGFRDVRVEEVRMPVVHASVADYLAYREAFGRLPESTVDVADVRRALSEYAAPYVDAAGRLVLDWQLLLVSARG